MSIPHWIKDLFESIDSKNTEKFVSFITDDGEFIFANMPPVVGKKNIIEFLNNFFPSIKQLKHDIFEVYSFEAVIVIKGIVTYTRHDDSNLSVKFCNIFHMEESKISKYDIYMDSSQLYR